MVVCAVNALLRVAQKGFYAVDHGLFANKLTHAVFDRLVIKGHPLVRLVLIRIDGCTRVCVIVNKAMESNLLRVGYYFDVHLAVSRSLAPAKSASHSSSALNSAFVGVLFPSCADVGFIYLDWPPQTSLPECPTSDVCAAPYATQPLAYPQIAMQFHAGHAFEIGTVQKKAIATWKEDVGAVQ